MLRHHLSKEGDNHFSGGETWGKLLISCQKSKEKNQSKTNKGPGLSAGEGGGKSSAKGAALSFTPPDVTCLNLAQSDHDR